MMKGSSVMRGFFISLTLITLGFFSFGQENGNPGPDKLPAKVLPRPSVSPLRGFSQAKAMTMAKPMTQKLEESKRLLATKEKVRTEVAQDPHGTSSTLMTAAETVGHVAELEAANPEKKGEFQSYYKSCYESSDVGTVTRVQCLRRYEKNVELGVEEIASILDNLPRPVQNLYRRAFASP
jgi:hypothetical protein